CARVDVDEHWLWLRAERMSQDEDCEFDEAELSFCSQAHAAEYLARGDLEWPEHDHSSRTSGTRVDTFFMGCGLLAIILSVVGIVALVRWVL
ncbi:MAG TPA: hypothetical protein VLI04_15715, partial [Nocardioidaceae bacterium]|nr:hypothetical protein [Nocardioidaceae bacterium]